MSTPSGLTILWNNQIDSASLSSSSQASNFPVVYLQDSRLIKAWNSTAPNNQWVLIDAGSGNTLAADTFSIIAHNISASATITIMGDNGANWISPAFQMTVPYDSKLMIAYFASIQTYRYFYLSINDVTNPAGYLSIGRLYLCLKSNFPGEPCATFFHDIDTTTIKSRSISMQVYGDLGYQTNTYTLAWGYVTDATKQSIQAIWRAQEMVNPVICIPDPSNTSKLPAIYSTMEAGIGFTQQMGYVWLDTGSSSKASSGGMVFEEAL